MGYLDGLGKVMGKTNQDVRPLKWLMEDNRASRLAKSLGYRYVHQDSDEVTWAAGNPDISSVAMPDSFPSLWLRKSVLREIGGRFGFNDGAQDERFRRNYRSSFARLDSVPGQPEPEARRLPHPAAARPVHLRRAGAVGHLPEHLGRGHPLAARDALLPPAGRVRRAQAPPDRGHDPQALEGRRDRHPGRRGLRVGRQDLRRGDRPGHPGQGPARPVASGRPAACARPSRPTP